MFIEQKKHPFEKQMKTKPIEIRHKGTSSSNSNLGRKCQKRSNENQRKGLFLTIKIG